MRKQARRGAGALAAVLVLAAASAADVIPLAGGWQANVADAATLSIVVEDVGPEVLTISITKLFTDPPQGGVFPAKLIDFVQIEDDANTVPRIVIAEEALTNQTGAPWTDFHWILLDRGEAWLNVPASADFDTAPLVDRQFSDPDNIFGDPDKATRLEAAGGLVPDGGAFLPGAAGGALVIDVDLSGPGFLSFTLKQLPTPEPAGLALLGLGAALGHRRRR